MILAAPSNYGPLGGLVGSVGSLIAATAAIVLGFRGRARWEPAEEDLPKGPQKVVGLLNAVGIAVIWSQMKNPASMQLLTRLAIGLAIACFLFLCAYALLIGMQTYRILISPARNRTASRNIVGGFSLIPEAEKVKREKNLTVQEVLDGAAYNPDRVWTRFSRGVAKLSFILCYVGLTVCGTTALTCAAMLTGAAEQR